MSRRAVSVTVRVLLLLGAGMLFGLLAAVGGSLVGAAPSNASGVTTCNVSSGTANVALGDGLTTLLDSSGALDVNGSSCGTFGGTPINAISFSVQGGAVPTGITLDQTGTVFPCVPISSSGSLGNIPVQVTATANETVSFGTTGVNVIGSGCGSIGTLTGVSAYSVLLTGSSGSTGPVTVNATGANGTGSATTATLTAPPNTAAKAYTLGGNVTLDASAGSYTVTSSSGGNQILGGGSSESFTLTAGSSAITFLGSPSGTYTLNGLVAGTQVTGGGGTESFTLSGSAVTFQGSSGGAYTVGGLLSTSTVTAGTGTETFTLTGPLSGVTASGGTDSSGNDSFSVTGAGNTGNTLQGGSGTTTFSLPGNTNTGNQLTGASGSTTFTLSGNNNTGNTLTGGSGPTTFNFSGTGNGTNVYHGGAGTDTVTIVGSNNTFVVGSGTENFFDTGSSNTVDFGSVGASPSDPLVINDAGSSQSGLSNGQATLGGGALYTFRDSPSLQTSADFTTFKGATGGSTRFLAGAAGGVTFTGFATGNSAAFFGGTTGIVANASGGDEAVNATIAPSTSVSGFTLHNGQVLVGNPGAAVNCGSPLSSFCDAINDVFNITGPTGGFSTFFAGAPLTAPDTYVFSDAGSNNTFLAGSGPATFSSAGDNNTFVGGTGTDNFSSSGNNNTFIAGFGNETFTETTTSQVPNNTIDFSHVPVLSTDPGCTLGPCQLTINVSGAGSTVPNFAAELHDFSLNLLATYTFGGSGGGADFTTLIGALHGNTSFLGGSGSYTYTGQGSGNSLDFSNVPSGTATSLTFDVTHNPFPQAKLGAVPETFSGITRLVGLSGGSTTFIAGSTGGFTFTGEGTGNQAIFNTPAGVVVNLSSSNYTTGATYSSPGVTVGAGDALVTGAAPGSSCAVTPALCDSLVDISVITGPTGGGSVFVAGPTSETFTDAGSAGGDTIDFSHVATGSLLSVLTVNVNGGSGSFVATVNGGPSYTFSGSNGGSNFTQFVGSLQGFTTFLAGPNPNYSFTAFGSNNSVDFSAAGPVNVDLGGSTLVGTVAVGGGFDNITGLSTVLGGSGGSNVFTAGSAPGVTYNFTGPGNNNTFFAGSSSDVFVGTGTGNIIDFSLLPINDKVTLNVSSGLSSPAPNSATGSSNGSTYTFSAVPMTFVGSPGGTLFYAGTLLDTFKGNTSAPAGSNELSYFFASGTPLVVSLVAPVTTGACTGVTGAGQATLAGAAQTFCGISVFDGLSGGSTTFVAGDGTGGYTFNGNGTNSTNTADFSPASLGVTIDLSSTSKNVTNALLTGSSADTITGISSVIGSSHGNNTFIAGPTSATFADNRGSGADTIDFSHVATGSLSSVLTVNVNGGSGSFTASVAGGGPTYRFTTGGADFTQFDGSSQGFTTFLAGPNPNYSFTAFGSNNSVDFSTAGPVSVNLGGSTLVGTVAVGGGFDHITGLSTVLGGSGGSNVFTAGSAPGVTYNFTGPGNNNTFFAGSSPDVFIGTGTGNVVSFANLPVNDKVTLNVSSGLSSPAPNSAIGSSNGSTYTFSAVPMTFVGSPGGTLFYAGTLLDTFVGNTSAPVGSNELSYFFASGTPLVVSLVAPVSTGACSGVTGAGQATLAGAAQTFCGISVFDGLSGGSTTFVAGDGTGGYTFNGNGASSTNTADFSPASQGVTIDLSSSSKNVTNALLTGSNADTITGISSVVGSSHGDNTFIAGPTSATFADNRGSGADTIDFSHVATGSLSSVLTVNVSGGSNSFTASVAGGGPTYRFTTGGADFTQFDGSSQGFTTFLAGPNPNYSFTGQGSNNTVDFSALTSNLTVDMVAQQATFAAGSDSLLGTISSVVGSPTGANTFFGALTGTFFTSKSANNKVSYAEITGPVLIDLTTNTVSGPGSADTFGFQFGTPVIVGSQGNDTFVASTHAVVLQGGGGTDTLDLSNLTNGVVANLSTGSVTGTGIGGITFTPCTTGTSDQLCLEAIIGTPGNDTFTVSALALNLGYPQISITGGGGTDTLSLSKIAQSAAIDMGSGTVTGISSGQLGIVFNGITNVFGTQSGGDYVFAGTGTANIFESGTPGTLDFSNVGAPVGVTVTVTTTSGTPTGTATNSLSSLSYTFTGFTTFFGTALSDSFVQNGPGTFNFSGLQGNNTLSLNGLPSSVVVSLTPDGACDSGNSDGTAFLSGQVNDHFTCIFQVSSGGSLIYVVTPGETTSVNGGGTGILELSGSPTGGATINLGTGQVTGGGYDFSFSGMSTIDGTPFNDVFIAGPGNFTLNGEGGSDTISYIGATSAVVVNDSSSSYTVPTGYANAGSVVAAHSTLGGYTGVIRLNGIYNMIASATNSDILVADNANYGSLTGGAGNDRFVLTGADNYLYAGTGNATLDLSLLPGSTSLNLATSSLQPLGTGAGFVTLGGGNITTVVASPGGSQIWGGTGNITLVGGPGSDWLAAGTGNQTLTGGGGSDTLVGGVGSDTLQGGSTPVTFVPGQGSDTLTSSTGGNTLNYSGAPSGVSVNLSNQQFSVPAGEPLAGTTLALETATGGWGATVSLAGAGISTVIGTNQTDIFVTGSSDTITGNGGADLFVVNGGNNTLFAGPNSGSRFLFDQLPGYQEGNNVINGGGNGTVDFSLAPAGVNVNLQTGNGTGGWGGFQQIAGILNIIGSQFSDVLVAGGPGGTVIGLNGNDLLIAGPSGGDTLESGGSGNDTFCAQSSCADGNLTGGGDVLIGGSGNDVFFTQNGVPDVINGGAGFNSAFTDPVEKSVTNIDQQTVG